jgi:hypothetical protein
VSSNGNGGDQGFLSSAVEEVREFLLHPFEIDEKWEKLLMLETRQTEILESEFVSGSQNRPALVGDPEDATIDSDRPTVEIGGVIVEIPAGITPDQDIKVANERYIEDTRTEVESVLQPGESKIMAEITVAPEEVILFRATNATAHSNVQYNYYFNQGGISERDLNPSDADDDLSGSAPWATPPDLFAPYAQGPMGVESSIALQIVNQDADTVLDPVQGTLTGTKIRVF